MAKKSHRIWFARLIAWNILRKVSTIADRDSQFALPLFPPEQ